MRCHRRGGIRDPAPGVGFELEWFVRRDGEDVTDRASILAAIATGGPLPHGSRITFEPGGQVEVSTPPAPDGPTAVDHAAEDALAVRTRLATAGMELVAVGLDAGGPRRRVADEPRYAAMARYFDRLGSAGATMMCGTASLQVNIGFDGDLDAHWEYAHDLAPVLGAMFAHSPLVDGRPSGWQSSRLAVWAALEPRRTGPVPTRPGARNAWIRYALDAPVMLMHQRSDCVVPSPVPTLREWIEQGHDGTYPDADDVGYHLTTLFPPVRPRGWIELRVLDALPEPWWRVAAAITVTALGDRAVRAGSPPGWTRPGTGGSSRPGGAFTKGACAPPPRRSSRPRSRHSRRPATNRRWCWPRTSSQSSTHSRGGRSPTTASTNGTRPGTRSVARAAPHPEPMTPATAQALEDARARTLAVLAPLTDEQLRAQHSPLMSPLVWDLAHIADYEELWLLRELGTGEATDPRFDDIYDAFRHPRGERPDLDLLGPDDARAFGAAVRTRVLAAGAPDLGERTDLLLADELVHGLVIRHEHQHIETMLATMQLMSSGLPDPAGRGPGRAGRAELVGAEVLVPAGPFVMGTDHDPWAYDNERPAHAVDLPAFAIDAAPTTNAQYRAFVDAGGYDDPRYWTDAGWKWRQSEDLGHPQFWSRVGADWVRGRFGVVEPLPELEPVQHVCWYEADAYARWAGKRLPTEAEWEKAASWDPASGTGIKARHPWGTEPPQVATAALAGFTAAVGSRRGRRPSRRRVAFRDRRPARRGVGVDQHRVRRVSGFRELSLPRVLRGLLRRRVQGAAGRFLGHPSRRGEHDLPELGPPHPPPDLLRLPLRPGSLMCRHLGYVGPSRPVRRSRSTRRIRCAPRAGRPGRWSWRRTTPTGGAWPGGSRVTRRRTGTAPPRRCGTTTPSPTATDPRSRSSVRSARRHPTPRCGR